MAGTVCLLTLLTLIHVHVATGASIADKGCDIIQKQEGNVPLLLRGIVDNPQVEGTYGQVSDKNNGLNHPHVPTNKKSQVSRAKRSPASDSWDTCIEQANASWGLQRISHGTPDTPGNYQYRNTGHGVDVYVLDSGIDTQLDEFGGRASNTFLAPTLKAEGHDDIQGHGTKVAGIVGGKVYGVAKEIG